MGKIGFWTSGYGLFTRRGKTMPVHYPSKAGQPYRPSNGTEGMMFMERWCSKCSQDTEESPCEILTSAMVFGITDKGYPREWAYDKEGRPFCTAFTDATPEEHYRCPETPDLFEDKRAK
jgi:hypothetical protein